MAICALLVLRMFSGIRKKVAAAAGSAEQLAGVEGAAGFLPAGAGGAEPLMLRKQIAETLQNNPEQARQLFAGWLEEVGE